MSTPQSDYEELALTSVAGLQAVFDNVVLLYERGRATVVERLIPTTSPLAEQFRNTFHSLRKKINTLVSDIEAGERVTTNDAATLQEMYDAFVTAEGTLLQYQPVEEKIVTDESFELVESVTPVVAPPSSQEDVLSGRTSLKLSITSAEQISSAMPIIGTAKKKKRRRKKSRASHGATTVEEQLPAQAANALHIEQGKIYALLKQARSIFSTIIASDTAEQEVLTNAKELLEEIQLTTTASRQLLQESDVPFVAEKLSYHHTIAETVLAELEMLCGYVSQVAVSEKGTLATLLPESFVSIPITTSAVTLPAENKSPPPQTVVSFIPSTVTTRLANPVNRSVPKELVALTRPDAVHEPFSLTVAYLTKPQYQAHIAEHYSSSAAFERILDASVTTLEAKTIDGIDRWLGDTPASAFHFVKDMSLAEFEQFAKAGYLVVTDTLRAENIKYDTFLVWRDLYDEMVTSLPTALTMTYGELFATFMIENDIASLTE